MKATVDRAELGDALGWLRSVVGDRVPLPYIGNVQVEAAGEALVLYGANFERCGVAHVPVPATCEANGTALVNLKRFHEASALGDTASVHVEDRVLHVVTEKSRFELGLTEETPPLTEHVEPPSDQETLHGDDVAAAIRAAYSATGSAYEFSKVVRAIVGNEGVQFGATDDARVHLSLHGECELKDMEGYRLLSSNDAETIAKTVKGQDTQIGVGKHAVTFHTEDRVLTVRTVDMSYRDLSIPFQNLAADAVVTASAEDLQQAVKVAAPFDANQERPQVDLRADGEYTLCVSASSDGEQGSVTVPCVVSGAPESARLRVIGKYLTDALKHCEGEVELSISPGRGALVEGGSVLCMVGGIKEE